MTDHTRMIHGSRPNRSSGPRMGFVITYMTPATQMTGPRTGAMLVRGVDRYGHFEPETVRPAADFDPAGLAAHEEAMRPFSQAIYQGAETSERRAKTTDATR
jgi:hypothetical protein